MTVSATEAFDRLAPTYDESFTETSLGRELRARVWERLSRHFPPDSRVLELNCGTGEDALFLARRGVAVTATDGSPAMLEAARLKAARHGLADAIRFELLDLARPRLEATDFDGVFSNFGGLNCVEDLTPLSRHLAGWLRPGAQAVLVVMGPLCLWEVLPSLARGAPKSAFRRMAGSPSARVGEETIRLHYPWPSELARTLGPELTATRVEGLGVALPPSLRSRSMERRPRFLRTLRRSEHLLRGVWPFRLLGDHYVLELERRRS